MESYERFNYIDIDKETSNLTVIAIGLNRIIDEYKWIKKGSAEYDTIYTNVVSYTFRSLSRLHQVALTDMMAMILNVIYVKYSFGNGPALWKQLIQNSYMDLRSILNMLLPFIDDLDGEKRNALKTLEDLYLDIDEDGKYRYTNSQINRCIRFYDEKKDKINIVKRPYILEYLYDHTRMLAHSISALANKLYINWLDVIPLTINNYKETQIYRQTLKKIYKKTGDPITAVFVDHYTDLTPGLGYDDIYNVAMNHLYQEIADMKWMIYDVVIEGRVPRQYVDYLDDIIDTEPIWKGIAWSELSTEQADDFSSRWNMFALSTSDDEQVIIKKIYKFFKRNYRHRRQLEKSGILEKPMSFIDSSDVYTFFLDEYTKFKKTWFYHVIKEKKIRAITKTRVGPVEISVTPKNVYNYAKSMVHSRRSFIPLERHWESADPITRKIFLIRLHDINVTNKEDPDLHNVWDDTSPNWFDISNNLRLVYGKDIAGLERRAARQIHREIHTRFIDIIFESLIYHGMLSQFSPSPNITDDNSIAAKLGSRNMFAYKRQQIDNTHFQNTSVDYANDAYSYITGTPYKNLMNGKYFEFLTTEQGWTFTYAMNWVSQLNFFHHYSNNRVIMVTGATGAGKSTQVPKLLMYAMLVIDYNHSGKTICTQPRIPPTTLNAGTISKELGVPIHDNDNERTSNFFVQFKHSKSDHVQETNNYLRIVTDGTLYQQLKNNAYLTRNTTDLAKTVDGPVNWVKKYLSENKYDIVIVDEAHEHNANMDMILTIMRNVIYVNNSIKLVIVSATMDDDEPIYRRYYRDINDNRMYPVSVFLEYNSLDRANIDRRFHISPPGQTTRYAITVESYNQEQYSKINADNFAEIAVQKTLEVARQTDSGNMLLFLTTVGELVNAVKTLNDSLPQGMIAMDYHGKLDSVKRKLVENLKTTIKEYDILRQDFYLDPEKARKVPPGTYKRIVIVATNIAEASLTIPGLEYIIDPGYQLSVTYDPVTSAFTHKKVHISQSSSVQRKGRVGRIAAGTVYQLYAPDAMKNNKTSYGITANNIQDVIMDNLITSPYDTPLVTEFNDFNSPRLLNLIDHSRVDGELEYWKSLGNIRPFEDIIERKYGYANNYSTPENKERNSYTYYGKGELDIPDDIDEIMVDFRQFITENHDDYFYVDPRPFQYQRYHTGFDIDTLYDYNTDFYIIHPDENLIVRDMHTGQVIGIKKDEAVSDKYFERFKKYNRNIESEPIISPKIEISLTVIVNYLAVVGKTIRERQIVIMYLVTEPDGTQGFINYTAYYAKVAKQYGYPKNVIYVNQLYQNISQLERDLEFSSNSLDQRLQLAFSINPGVLDNSIFIKKVLYSGERDVSKLSDLFETRKNYSDDPLIQRYNTNSGDMHFLFTLSVDIISILDNSSIRELLDFENTLNYEFSLYKSLYMDRKKLPEKQRAIFSSLQKNGLLNTTHELYGYAKFMSVDARQLSLKLHKLSRLNEYIRTNELSTSLIDNIYGFIQEIYGVKKRMWIKDYEYRNSMDDDRESAVNVVEWALQLEFPAIPVDPTKWDLYYETYVRSHTFNIQNTVVVNMGDRYMSLSNDQPLNAIPWARTDPVEMTFLIDKPRFIIHEAIVTQDSVTGPTLLSPIQPRYLSFINPFAIMNYLQQYSSRLDRNRIAMELSPYLNKNNIVKFLRLLGEDENIEYVSDNINIALSNRKKIDDMIV